MSINHRWRTEHTENGSWIHTIGDESYVLRTYHHRTSWDQLPSVLKEDAPSHHIDDSSTDDSDDSDDGEIGTTAATTSSDQKESNESESKSQSESSGPNDDANGSSNQKTDHSASTIPLDAEDHAAFLDFSGDSFAQKRMINKWRCELNSFSLKNSSFGCIFDKRYNVIKSLFQHFEKHSKQSQYDPYYQMTHNKFKKHSKPDFSTVTMPMKIWQQIPGMMVVVRFCALYVERRRCGTE